VIGSNEICCWSFYGHGKRIAEVCCTAIVYATDRKNTKVEFPEARLVKVFILNKDVLTDRLKSGEVASVGLGFISFFRYPWGLINEIQICKQKMLLYP
jgi:hypothetical protein